jgi:hypothetical protein
MTWNKEMLYHCCFSTLLFWVEIIWGSFFWVEVSGTMRSCVGVGCAGLWSSGLIWSLLGCACAGSGLGGLIWSLFCACLSCPGLGSGELRCGISDCVALCWMRLAGRTLCWTQCCWHDLGCAMLWQCGFLGADLGNWHLCLIFSFLNINSNFRQAYISPASIAVKKNKGMTQWKENISKCKLTLGNSRPAQNAAHFVSEYLLQSCKFIYSWNYPFVCNPKVHCCIKIIRILSHMDVVRIVTLHFVNLRFNILYNLKAKAKLVPLHAMEALGGRGGVVPTHSRHQH